VSVLRILKVNAATSYNFIIGKLKELQQRILAMSPAERKGLGINESTLWYQNRKLAEGKKTRIYYKVLSKMTAA
jgi:hypothetical protein